MEFLSRQNKKQMLSVRKSHQVIKYRSWIMDSEVLLYHDRKDTGDESNSSHGSQEETLKGIHARLAFSFPSFTSIWTTKPKGSATHTWTESFLPWLILSGNALTNTYHLLSDSKPNWTDRQNQLSEAGETAQLLGALVALEENLVLIPNTHMAHTHL